MDLEKKVVLVLPPSRAKTARPPLGPMYISSVLTKKGIDNDIIDIKSNEPLYTVFDKIIEKIKGIPADIIGISCLVTEIEITEELCRKIKEIKPNAKVILGGAQPTTHPEHFVKAEKFIDYFVIGEGEITFPELVKEIRKKSPVAKIKEIKGLAWFESGEIKKSSPRELIEDIDSLPLPAYDKVDMDYYTRPTPWGSRPILLSFFWIFSSRGCPFKCKYCVAHEIFGKTVRQRNPKKVVDEIEFLVKKYKVDGIYFYDESFTINQDRTVNICEEIIERGLKICFGCQTRVNLINDNALKAMAKAGFLQVDFGIESASDKMLKIIQKDITAEQIVMGINKCKKYGIRVFANMMLNLPEETIEDLNASISLMKKLSCNVVIWNVTVPYPGTFFDRKLEREDYKKLMDFPSDAAYDLLEKKYKFGKYDAKLKDLVDKLYGIFPHPRYLHFKLSPDYIRRWFLFFDYLFNPKYIRTILRSKKKVQYLKSIFSPIMHN